MIAASDEYMGKQHSILNGDIIFDGLAERFASKIYGSEKGDLRLALLWEDLQHHIPPLSTAKGLDVLDAGGGLGQMSIRVAREGHQVLLCEPSSEMMSKASIAITESGIPDNVVTLAQCPLQAIPAQFPDRQFDMVICHAVLEWLAAPLPTLGMLLPLVKPGGFLSLAFYNVESIVWKNLLKGNFRKVSERRFAGETGGLTPPNPQSANSILPWLTQQDFEILNTSGIRCVSDYLYPSANVSAEALLDMERELGQREPYKWLGRYIHVIARREC